MCVCCYNVRSSVICTALFPALHVFVLCRSHLTLWKKSSFYFFYFLLVSQGQPTHCNGLHCCFLNTSLSLMGNSGHLTWVRHSSRKSSATHSYRCVQYVHVSKQGYGCQRLGFLQCEQTLRHAIAHWGLYKRCKKVSTGSLTLGGGSLNLGGKSLASPGTRTASVLCLAFQSDAQPAELSRTSSCHLWLHFTFTD